MTQAAAPAPARRRVRIPFQELVAAARTPRMLGLLALIVVAAVVCVRLGAWQIDRAFERADVARQAEEAAAAEAGPTPLGDMLDPGAHVMGAMVGQPVEAVGTFDPEQEVLVPGRLVAGEQGYLVVTPLRVASDDAWLPVVRGWVAQPTDVAPAPDGEVRVAGAVTAGEAWEPEALPAGQVDSISPAYFAGVWGTPIFNAYLVQSDPDPAAAGMVGVPLPSLDGGGVDIRNLAYAIEWYVFGAFALLVWYRLVREEALVRREDAEAAATDLGATEVDSTETGGAAPAR